MVRPFSPQRPVTSSKGLVVASRIQDAWKGVGAAPGAGGIPGEPEVVDHLYIYDTSDNVRKTTLDGSVEWTYSIPESGTFRNTLRLAPTGDVFYLVEQGVGQLDNDSNKVRFHSTNHTRRDTLVANDTHAFVHSGSPHQFHKFSIATGDSETAPTNEVVWGACWYNADKTIIAGFEDDSGVNILMLDVEEMTVSTLVSNVISSTRIQAAVSDGQNLYFGGWNNAVVKVDSSGSIQWTTGMGARVLSVFLYEHVVYAYAENGNFRLMDKDTGDIIFSGSLDDRHGGADVFAHSPNEGTVYASDRGNIREVDLEGNIVDSISLIFSSNCLNSGV